MRVLAAAALSALTITALWWARAWAQYNKAETTMATAMHNRDWDNDCN